MCQNGSSTSESPRRHMTCNEQATSSDQSSFLLAAFPAALRSEAAIVASLVGSKNVAHPELPIVVRGESLSIPYRVFPDADTSPCASLNEVQARIYACALTRHHDGHVRQRQLEQIVTLSDPWVVPFVVQLCGEYVSEILDVIEQHLPTMHPPAYGEFFRENPRFFQQTESRMASYWDSYYRWVYKRKADYVGFKLFKQFRAWKAQA